jgi:hypothetical protein
MGDADPDGNRLECQVDGYASDDAFGDTPG